MGSKSENKKPGHGQDGVERKKLKTEVYEKELFKLQVELCKLQQWVKESGTRAIVLFEGRDAAGKGGVLKRITERVSRELREIPGVRNFGAHIGRAEVADEVVGVEFTELWVSLDPEVDYRSAVARIQEVVDGYPGLFRDVLTYLKERIKEVLTGASATIVVRIFGPELDGLRGSAERVAASCSAFSV